MVRSWRIREQSTLFGYFIANFIVSFANPFRLSRSISKLLIIKRINGRLTGRQRIDN